MKRFFGCTFLLVLSLSLAQAQDHKLVDIMVKHWQTSKMLSLAVADAMPDDGYSFKATPGEMSFGEQINHIASADGFYCAAAGSGANPLPKNPGNTKAEAEKNLTAAYDFCISGMQKMSDADLMKMMGSGQRQATAFEMFWGAFTHAAHHRGQLEVYLRLKGITPPSYKF